MSRNHLRRLLRCLCSAHFQEIIWKSKSVADTVMSFFLLNLIFFAGSETELNTNGWCFCWKHKLHHFLRMRQFSQENVFSTWTFRTTKLSWTFLNQISTKEDICIKTSANTNLIWQIQIQGTSYLYV